MKRIAIVASSLLVLVAILVIPAASMQQGDGEGPTNLQVLPEGAPVGQIMRNIRDALGVNCAFCHVDGDRASDDIDKKVIAREMMRMLGTINEHDALTGIEARVNCATCHRGSATRTNTF
jgi:photosynthetic reaction center cytochrome c subunit